MASRRLRKTGMRRNKPARKHYWLFLLAVPLLCVSCIGLYFLPPVYDRLDWRVDEVVLRIRYALNPPQKQVFVPTQQNLVSPAPPILDPTSSVVPSAAQQSPTASPAPLEQTPTPMPSPTPAPPTATPLPPQVSLSGVRYEDQHGRQNYCAPANLSMGLTFWNWPGNRDVVGPAIKPDSKDKNVMPYEMVDYVNAQTNLRALTRMGGSVQLLQSLLAAGYPVLVEKGIFHNDMSGVVSWMGHFQVLTGYDQAGGYFIAQDSLLKPDMQVTFDQLVKGWRAFNYQYILIYPPEREAEVLTLLGPDADEQTNYANAALLASNEIYGLAGIDQYFAWFNRGTSLAALQDYGGAAQAYDQAFAIYPNIPENERPWRMLWYQTGPYKAYYGVQRYYDLLYLADGTLNAMQSDRNLEESYYWRAMARLALGQTQAAIEDFRLALKYHPAFPPAVYQLQLLGVTP